MVGPSDPLLKEPSQFDQKSELSTSASEHEETLSQRIDSLRGSTAFYLHKEPVDVTKEEMKLYFKKLDRKRKKKLARKKNRIIAKSLIQDRTSMSESDFNRLMDSPEDFLFKVNSENGLSAQRYIELRIRTARTLKKPEEQVTKLEMNQYLNSLQDQYEKKKARSLSAISRFVITRNIEKLSSSIDELEESDKTLLLEIKKGQQSSDKIFTNIPSTKQHILLYWEEALCIHNDPVLIYNIAKRGFSNPGLEQFPFIQQPNVLKACKRIFKLSIKKVKYDPVICRLLSSPDQRARILCQHATKKNESDNSFLDLQTEEVIDIFTSSKDEIKARSREVITQIVISPYLEEKIQELKREILRMRTTFDLEFFLHSFDQNIYQLINQFNLMNMELIQQEFGKGHRTNSAGEDEFLPIAVYFIHRINHPKVYERLQGLSNMGDMSLLSSHQQFLFTRAIGASMAARSLIEDYLDENPPEINHPVTNVSEKAASFLAWMKGKTNSTVNIE